MCTAPQSSFTDARDVSGSRTSFLSRLLPSIGIAEPVRCRVVCSRARGRRAEFLGPSAVIVEPGQDLAVNIGITNATYTVSISPTASISPISLDRDHVGPLQRRRRQFNQYNRRDLGGFAQLHALRCRQAASPASDALG